MTATTDGPAAPVPTHPHDLALALRLADVADAISLARFGAADLRVTSKPDLTPVSDADLAVETAMRELLTAERPGDAVLGEEFGGPDQTEPNRTAPDRPGREGRQRGTGPGAARRWVIDPIDGTKNFVRGVPVWATLIALFDGDDVVVGVVSAPALARRWWAGSGGGAFTRFAGDPARTCGVSGVADLQDASLAYSDLREWEEQGRGDQFRALLSQCWRTRGYGDFLPYMLVAQGAADIAAEPELSLWDLAALVPVVREAGGTFTDVDGGPVGPATVSALATNGVLHDRVVGALARSDQAIDPQRRP